MIFTEKKKEIRVMFTPFRDGLQSVCLLYTSDAADE